MVIASLCYGLLAAVGVTSVEGCIGYKRATINYRGVMLVQYILGRQTQIGAYLRYRPFRLFCRFQKQYHDFVVCT